MLEIVILSGLALWLGLALRACARNKCGCGGDCGHCRGCGR